MTPITACVLALAFTADPTPTAPTPHPLAPSLPLLTDAEEEAFDAVIDRFILADTGKLDGAEARAAIEAFRRLGSNSTFAQIRGMNKAAAIDHSCPAVTIARKLHGTLTASRDVQLLEFARENIGAGVDRSSRHLGVLRDLKLACTARKAALERAAGPRLP
jgi:hypothetical protein